MDLTPSIIPKSDQLNADEIMAPVTYTIREVKAGSVEQPFDFMLVETDRAYRPSKTMRRVIVAAWGAEAANYAGRRLTLYREPTIKYGGVEVGGIRISHMSHIDGPVEVMAQTTRGKREKFTVQPLESAAPAAGNSAESPSLPGQSAADEPAAAPGANGGGLIETLEDAQRLIAPLKGEQLGVMKRMLDLTGTTTKREMAEVLLEQRFEWDPQDILAELAGWSS
jgi:hypothetical protein